jgi:hypothetical protein
MRKRLCDDHKTWTSDEWKYVIWSGDRPSWLFPTSGRVCVWRTPKEACNPEYLDPTGKHGGGSVMIWSIIFRYSAGPIIALNGQITASDYMDILGDPVNPVVQMLFPNNDDAGFQDDNSPIHTASRVHSWFEVHEDALHLPWPAHSPDFITLEPLWSELESRTRSMFPPPSSVK